MELRAEESKQNGAVPRLNQTVKKVTSPGAKAAMLPPGRS